MGYSSSQLFAWLQGADFYRGLHLEAVAELPSGVGKRWVDVGCGPGLLTRLAAGKGYDAVGIDMDPAMVREAQKIARREKSAAVFEVDDVFKLPPQSADVVSASSLLATLDEKADGFRALLTAVRPGGSLLIIEPTDRMSVSSAEELIRSGLPNGRIAGLRMWARAREGHAVDPSLFRDADGHSVVSTPLLGGLVGSWLITKAR